MSRRRAALLVLALAVAAALIVIGVLRPREAAAGWLIAFIYASAVPLGSLALLLIHRLTGGLWGEALRPFFEPASFCIALATLLFIPVLIALPVLYPWVAGAGPIKPNVGAYYLNSPLFIVRALLALIGWSVLALALPRVGGKSGTLLAGVGLIFYAIFISFVSIDWILSAEPAFVSTSFGASLAVMQILAALAFAALAAPGLDERAVRDLGGLMLAVALGLTYIDFMAVLVIWYSDLPHKVDWFVARVPAPWRWLAVAAFILGSVVPVLALLLERVRASRAGLRFVGAVILTGLACYDVYLLAPAYGVWALGTAPLALVGLASALVFFAGLRWPAIRSKRARTAHD